MKCKNCGSENVEYALYCGQCGTALEGSAVSTDSGQFTDINSPPTYSDNNQNSYYPTPTPVYNIDESANKKAITGFVCGIIGLSLLSIPLGVIGIVFSSKGLHSPKSGFAVAGLILSICALVGAVIWMIASRGEYSSIWNALESYV